MKLGLEVFYSKKKKKQINVPMAMGAYDDI
jgi:hypothetical protein